MSLLLTGTIRVPNAGEERERFYCQAYICRNVDAPGVGDEDVFSELTNARSATGSESSVKAVAPSIKAPSTEAGTGTLGASDVLPEASMGSLASVPPGSSAPGPTLSKFLSAFGPPRTKREGA